MIKSWLTVVALVALGVMTPVVAQVPTAEQLELLRTMSPEDREALMEQLGIGGSVLGSGGDTDSGGTLRKGRGEGDLDMRDEDDFSIKPRMVDKSFKPLDYLLVDIDFKKDKPPRIESQGEGLPPITIPGEQAPELTPDERLELQALIDLIRSKNPYQLDTAGSLTLPGFVPITLAGLDDKQASLRLAAIQTLRKLDVKVVPMPVRKQGAEALKPFGYDLFKRQPSTFAPFDVPVPADYIVGPGDQLLIQLFGTQNRTLRQTVSRDGAIQIPGIGPVQVSGRTFSTASSEIERRVSEQLIGVRASVSMGDARSIRVFVTGEVTQPGSYVVSSLATLTSALYASGGIKPIGSLRDIQLKRQGAVVRHLDLYDLLLRGDTSEDTRVRSGDVIFVPPVGATVAIDGEVRRPAIYELKGETTVEDAILLAGGVTPEADTGRVALVRVDESRMRTVLDVPIDSRSGRSSKLRNGDSLRVLRLRPTLDRGVIVEGHVFRPGPVAWREGLRLTDVLTSIDELRPNADAHYILIRRELAPDRRIATVSADLTAALREPTSEQNIQLMPRDRIMVFDEEAGRRQLLDPLITELRRQSRVEEPGGVVRIDGRVRARGEYPLEMDMRVSDLLRAGGGLHEAAYSVSAELTRYRVGGDARQTQLIEIDLAAVLRGDESADVKLAPFDFLNIKEIPEWTEQERVTILGEVRFPGTYPIQRGESLRSVLNRAGGLTSQAFAEGTVFTRTELAEREQREIDRLAERLQSDLAAAALQAVAASQGQGAQSLQVGQSLLNQLKATKAVGRLVINLEDILAGPVGAVGDIVLRDGDRLMIPKEKQEVSVIGEVQNTTSHLYKAEFSRDDYINMSGGVTRKADKGRIFVVRANGSVVSSESASWFRRSSQVAMKPGDTVVVPLDTERMPALSMWQAVTSILYNLAIAAAAVNSF
jgi:protein involved in polysaccharide export with SLBB domain